MSAAPRRGTDREESAKDKAVQRTEVGLPPYLASALSATLQSAEALLRDLGIDPAAAAAAAGQTLLAGRLTDAEAKAADARAEAALDAVLASAGLTASRVALTQAGGALFILQHATQETPEAALQALLAATRLLGYAEAMRLEHQLGATSEALGRAWDFAELELEGELSLLDMQRESEERHKRQKAAELGRVGADRRHAKSRALKTWAIEQAMKARGSDTQIARALVGRIPAHLRDASADPEGLIYKAIRAHRRAE